MTTATLTVHGITEAELEEILANDFLGAELTVKFEEEETEEN